MTRALELARLAAKLGVPVRGFSFHVGSQAMTPLAFQGTRTLVAGFNELSVKAPGVLTVTAGTLTMSVTPSQVRAPAVLTMTLTGTELKAALEQQWAEPARPRILQVSKGFGFAFDPAAAVERRLSSGAVAEVLVKAFPPAVGAHVARKRNRSDDVDRERAGISQRADALMAGHGEQTLRRADRGASEKARTSATASVRGRGRSGRWPPRAWEPSGRWFIAC